MNDCVLLMSLNIKKVIVSEIENEYSASYLIMICCLLIYVKLITMRDWFHKGNHILGVMTAICHEDNELLRGNYEDVNQHVDSFHVTADNSVVCAIIY